MPGVVYPFQKNDPGYNVTITVEDKYGNKSEPRLRTLKISDKINPVVKLIGSSEIHDFLRFSKNEGLSNNELLFADRNFNETENPEFDSSGFGGGAHRIILSDYNFVDPGAYAHDFGSYFRTSQGYKNNYGNDDFGETYAMRRVSERSRMVNCDDEDSDTVDIGVIFTYSVLEKVSNPTKHFQDLMASGDFGLDTTDLSETNSTFPPGGGSVALSAVKVPDVDNQPYDFDTPNKDVKTNMDVTKILIEYRVKDGWDNLSNIEERTVYIYESRQFDGFAFYATPITDGNGVAFEDYYDNNTSGSYLKLTRKDSDGDGVSDYWEKVFGSNPLDRKSVPVDENNEEIDFSDPDTFNGSSLSFDPLNSD